jgi:hypothetical protein
MWKTLTTGDTNLLEAVIIEFYGKNMFNYKAR